MKVHTREKSGVIAVTIKTHDGERTVSTGTSDPKLAKAIIKASKLDAIEVAAKANALSQDLIQKLIIGKKITVRQAIEEWGEWLKTVSRSDRTANNTIFYAQKFAKDCGLLTKAPSDITDKDVSKWINQEDGNQLGTKRVALTAIRNFTNWCSISKYMFGDPAAKVGIKEHLLSHSQKEPREKVPFTDDQINKLLTYLEKLQTELLSREMTAANLRKLNTARFWHCAVIFGRYSGLRLGDIASLEWESL